MTPNKKRLLVLADFLENELPTIMATTKKGFNLNYWDRGSTACAIGWATTIPEFKKAGLRLWQQFIPNTQTEPMHKQRRTVDTVKEFFSLDLNAIEFLFFSNSYSENVGPSDVAKRIREFITENL